jgi:glycosyltransferase involved in cell wall biosynthesis
LLGILPDTYEVILFDGDSVNGTVPIARSLRPDVRIVRQSRAARECAACGFAVTTGDVIAIVDADGFDDPGEIPRLVTALLDGADFAKDTAEC